MKFMLPLAIFAFSTRAWAEAPMENRIDHLRFEHGAIHAHIQWQHLPRLLEENSFLLTWEDGRIYDSIYPGIFRVALLPPHGRRALPPLVNPQKDSRGVPIKGRHVVSRVRFTSLGDWRVLIHLKPRSGQEETQVITLHF